MILYVFRKDRYNSPLSFMKLIRSIKCAHWVRALGVLQNRGNFLLATEKKNVRGHDNKSSEVSSRFSIVSKI